jgi:hypothetical protein
MTHLRKMMLEELVRRNYARTTIDCYIQTIDDVARHFHRPPDQLTRLPIRELANYKDVDFSKTTADCSLHGPVIQFDGMASHVSQCSSETQCVLNGAIDISYEYAPNPR